MALSDDRLSPFHRDLAVGLKLCSRKVHALRARITMLIHGLPISGVHSQVHAVDGALHWRQLPRDLRAMPLFHSQAS